MTQPSFMAHLKNQLEDQLPSLRQLLHAEMGGFKSARPLYNIHASDLTYEEKVYCPRLNAMCLLEDKTPPDQYVNTCLQYTFDLGEQMHELARCSLLKKYVVGYWKCPHCKHTTNTIGFQPDNCYNCGITPFQFQYVEVRFKCAVTGASGAIDCLLKFPNKPKLVVVELKSIIHKSDSKATPSFVELKAPLGEHGLRTNMYMRLIENSVQNLKQFIDVENAMVFYMTKGFGYKDPTLEKEPISDSMTPFKEYWVKRNDAETEYYVNRAIPMKNFLEFGIVPDRIDDAAACEACKMKSLCDSNNYPPQMQTQWHLQGSFGHGS